MKQKIRDYLLSVDGVSAVHSVEAHDTYRNKPFSWLVWLSYNGNRQQCFFIVGHDGEFPDRELIKQRMSEAVSRAVVTLPDIGERVVVELEPPLPLKASEALGQISSVVGKHLEGVSVVDSYTVAPAQPAPATDAETNAEIAAHVMDTMYSPATDAAAVDADDLLHDLGVLSFAGIHIDKDDAESLRTEEGGELYNHLKDVQQKIAEATARAERAESALAEANKRIQDLESCVVEANDLADTATLHFQEMDWHMKDSRLLTALKMAFDNLVKIIKITTIQRDAAIDQVRITETQRDLAEKQLNDLVNGGE